MKPQRRRLFKKAEGRKEGREGKQDYLGRQECREGKLGYWERKKRTESKTVEE